MGIIHGLAKDHSKLCWGYRNHPKAIGWGTEIELIENENQTVLTFSDSRHNGLTGHIPEDLNDAKILRKDFQNPDEKFSKILMFINTGINVTGARKVRDED